MTRLTDNDLVLLRRQMALGVVVTWGKPTINAALQAIEDVLEAQLFDASVMVKETIRTDSEAQDVKTRLDGGEVSLALVPVVEDWLLAHPPSVTTRTVDDDEIAITADRDRALFDSAVSIMPFDQRDKLIELVMHRRVEASV